MGDPWLIFHGMIVLTDPPPYRSAATGLYDALPDGAFDDEHNVLHTGGAGLLRAQFTRRHCSESTQDVDAAVSQGHTPDSGTPLCSVGPPPWGGTTTRVRDNRWSSFISGPGVPGSRHVACWLTVQPENQSASRQVRSVGWLPASGRRQTTGLSSRP